LQKRQNDFDLTKNTTSSNCVFARWGTGKDTKKQQKKSKCKSNHREKGIEEAGPTGTFGASGALFDVIFGTGQAKGTAVPAQALFVGVGKHRTIVFSVGVVAFTRRAATFQRQRIADRTGIALAAIAEDGRVG